MDNCGICKYWLADNFTDIGDLIGNKSNVGFCRRYPPNKITELSDMELEFYEQAGRLKSARFRQVFPFTGGEEWCGEFKSK